ALGTLEQLVTYSGERIDLEDVLAVLGVADGELLRAALAAVAGADAAGALRCVARCSEQGRDAAAFTADLEVHARSLLIVQVLGEVPAELSLTAEADASLAEQAAQVPRAAVVRLLDLLAAALEAVRAGADGRTQLELALVKAATPEVDGSMRALLARIERLEATLAAAPAAPASPPPPPALAAVPPEAAPVAQRVESAPAPLAPRGGGAALAAVAVAEPEPHPQDPHPQEPEPQAPPEPAPAGDPLGGLWPAVLEAVRAANAMLGHVLDEARPIALDGSELCIAFPTGASFLKRKAEDAGHREAVAGVLRAVCGRPLRPRYELRDPPEHDGAAPPPPTQEEWLARLIDAFDGELLDDTQDEGSGLPASRPPAPPSADTEDEGSGLPASRPPAPPS
ncbi:MAG TPA: hypothetical protein VHX88_03980, partial [Solirubrobacteraceae bacterium]|nr:hypothetical protein [Solirubrobacteraceae bacterium]